MSYERRYNTIDLQPDVAVGVKLPIVSTTGRLFDLSYSTRDQAISNLKNLILTRRGERLYQPLFGTRLYDYLFEQNDDLIVVGIQDAITEAVSFWLPYITINRLDVKPVIAVTPDNEEHGVQVTMEVSVENDNVNTPITFLITNNSVEEI